MICVGRKQGDKEDEYVKKKFVIPFNTVYVASFLKKLTVKSVTVCT